MKSNARLHKKKLVALDVITVNPVVDPIEAAQLADLQYVSDLEPGIRRQRAGKGFVYFDANNRRIRDRAVVKRIQLLRIPPAWTEVWICPLADGHIQATGRDAKGCKQYRYHVAWNATRKESKFGRMLAFGAALPQIRERLNHDLRLPGLPREKVLALVIYLLQATLIRVGNLEYARANRSFGLTTLRDDHVEISGATIQFEFRGKSGVQHSISITDRRVARLIKRCKDIRGQQLFQYLDSQQQRQTITSTDVNAYLHEITGQHFTAKDFRTWGGSALAVTAFESLGPTSSQREGKKIVTQAVKSVSGYLGNTPTVCLQYYIHPTIASAYLDGTLLPLLTKCRHECDKRSTLAASENGEYALRAEEMALMQLLQAAQV